QPRHTPDASPPPLHDALPTCAALIGVTSGMLETMPVLGGIGGWVITGGNPLGAGLGIAAGEAFKRGYRATMDVPTADEMPPELQDRKSTRLNSSHVKSSYAVF